MFIGLQNKKIVLAGNTREEVANAPCMTFDEIREVAEEYVLYEGEYLLKAEAEARQAAAEKEAHIKELKEQLDALDLKSLRALRAIQAGVGTEEDTQRIAALEEQAEQIRQELKEL